MLRTSIGLIALAASGASAQLSLVPGGVGTGTAFNAVGTEQRGNFKSYLEASGFPRLEGQRLTTQWWSNVERSWQIDWDDASETVTFTIFENNDYTGQADELSRDLDLGGDALSHLRIGARTTATDRFVTYSNVEFDGGSGFSSVAGADQTIGGGNVFTEEFYTIAGGRGDFTLRGVSLFQISGNSSTSDNFRMFVKVQVPTPASASLLAAAGLMAARRRR